MISELRVRRALAAVVLAGAGLVLAGVANADVKLPAVLADHMVLQQGMAVPIWGTADAGEEVTVTFGQQKQSTKADDKGHWEVMLGALTANDKPEDLTVSGKNKVELKDILVGEVWICSGQSNMEFGIGNASNHEKEIAESNHPLIRLFAVPRAVSGKPLSDLKPQPPAAGEWLECGPKTVGLGGWNGFTAVGYFFGRDLQNDLKVPVGLIHTSWGGTPAEAWTEKSYMESDPDLKPLVERMEKSKKPDQNSASTLYNGMIAPIVPFAVKGAIWYQGESNAGRAYQYRKLLPAMIKSWRDVWHEPDMDFYIVSLANYQDPPKQPGDSDWAELREAQAMTAAQPHNGEALAIDLADANNPGDIHPHNKQDVGHRLELVALAKTYGKKVDYSGPEYKESKTDGNKVTLHFDFADGLNAKGGGELKGFQIAGEDKKWHWADAKIEGDTVVVSSKDVEKPAAVRYDWANNPEGNLYNKAGLPTVPFRTDTWPGVTEKAK
ncbi:MAG TPA: sialate O-acetylesterase [Tepidisphaeraceae bacterium]|jgi:sialate O-acetylesterase|nr:sialate O-acetylesterase [Tepidisphaeraceae bacterium]